MNRLPNDDPSRAKRRKLASDHPLPSPSPSLHEEMPSLASARLESSLRMLNIWNSLEAKYVQDLDEDDIVDLRTEKLVKDRGKLESMRKVHFGFTLDSKTQAEDTTEDETNDSATLPDSVQDSQANTDDDASDDDEDEFGGWGELSTLDYQYAEVPALPKQEDMAPEDAADLRAFLEASSKHCLEEDDSDIEELEYESYIQNLGDLDCVDDSSDGKEASSSRLLPPKRGTLVSDQALPHDEDESEDELALCPNPPPSRLLPVDDGDNDDESVTDSVSLGFAPIDDVFDTDSVVSSPSTSSSRKLKDKPRVNAPLASPPPSKSSKPSSPTTGTNHTPTRGRTTERIQRAQSDIGSRSRSPSIVEVSPPPRFLASKKAATRQSPTPTYSTKDKTGVLGKKRKRRTSSPCLQVIGDSEMGSSDEAQSSEVPDSQPDPFQISAAGTPDTGHAVDEQTTQKALSTPTEIHSRSTSPNAFLTPPPRVWPRPRLRRRPDALPGRQASRISPEIEVGASEPIESSPAPTDLEAVSMSRTQCSLGTERPSSPSPVCQPHPDPPGMSLFPSTSTSTPSHPDGLPFQQPWMDPNGLLTQIMYSLNYLAYSGLTNGLRPPDIPHTLVPPPPPTPTNTGSSSPLPFPPVFPQLFGPPPSTPGNNHVPWQIPFLPPFPGSEPRQSSVTRASPTDARTASGQTHILPQHSFASPGPSAKTPSTPNGRHQSMRTPTSAPRTTAKLRGIPNRTLTDSHVADREISKTPNGSHAGKDKGKGKESIRDSTPQRFVGDKVLNLEGKRMSGAQTGSGSHAERTLPIRARAEEEVTHVTPEVKRRIQGRRAG